MKLQEWFDFFAAYPRWVIVAVVALVAISVLLLILFRPPRPTESSPPSPTGAQPVGEAVVLNLGQDQHKWNDLTAWAAAAGTPIRQLKEPFSRTQFRDYQPGVLIFPLPFHQLLTEDEITSLKDWVERGGGLLVLGYYATDTHHGSNLSRLTREWGISFDDNLLMPANSSEHDARKQVTSFDPALAVSIPMDDVTHEIAQGVKQVLLMSGASISVEHALTKPNLVVSAPPSTELWYPKGPLTPDGMRLVIEEWQRGRAGPPPVLVCFESGRGRVAIVSSWKVTTRDFADNRRLVTNLINWLRPRQH